jgi:uncharacterized DUF497 family protein
MGFEFDPVKSAENKRKHGMILRRLRGSGPTTG